jgi:hypothetical protein
MSDFLIELGSFLFVGRIFSSTSSNASNFEETKDRVRSLEAPCLNEESNVFLVTSFDLLVAFQESKLTYCSFNTLSPYSPILSKAISRSSLMGFFLDFEEKLGMGILEVEFIEKDPVNSLFILFHV